MDVRNLSPNLHRQKHNKNMDKTYKKRIADKLLSEQLEAAGAILIQGPKWCGKMTTAQQAAVSSMFLNAPSFMMVLTGVGTYAYTRTDGVTVVPISALGV